jgi:predicted permease
MNDLRLAFRSLVLRPGFSSVVVATLAIGVGINTAIFSVVDGVLLKPLPYRQSERIVTLWESNPQLDVAQDRVAAATFTDWAERSRSFSALGAYNFEDFLLESTGEPEQIPGARLSPTVFDVIGVQPALGRAFDATEAQPGNDRVVILGHAFWLRQFGGDQGALGRSVTLDGEPYTVVGVMPERFQFPPGAADVAVWTPLAIGARVFTVRAMRVYYVVAQLAPGVSVEQARAEMDGIAREIAQENPDSNRGWGVDVTPALEQVVGNVRLLLGVLAGSAGLVLLIACVNISNLLLVRSIGQSREFALRATLGAGGWRLLRRSLSESLVLAGGGGAVGLGVGVAGVQVLRRFLPPDLPRVDQVGVDLRVLAFAAAASLLAGVIFGLYPAFRAMRPDLAQVLQESGRSGAGGRHFRRVLDGLVSGQVALALLLLVGAGVTIRSMVNLLRVDPGFRVEGVLSVALSLPENAYPGRDEQIVLLNELVDRVEAVPDVAIASTVSTLPMSPLGIDFDLPIEIEGRDAPSPAERPRAGYRSVMPGYFEALGIPLVRGRLLDRFDREEGRPVMVLNETAERLLFPGEDPLGRILGVPMAGRIEIVGVVADVLHGGLDAEVVPELFVSHMNFPLRDTHLVVRAEDGADMATLAPRVRQAIRAVDPRLPIVRIASMEELIAVSLARPRFNMALLMAFAGCALVLAGIGIYGVVAYSVAQRSTEMGIRMALGSDRWRTFRLVVGQTLAFVAAGAAVGVLGAFAVSRLVRGILFGVGPLDPVTLATVVTVLALVATVAAGLPAWRGVRTAPARALSP